MNQTNPFTLLRTHSIASLHITVEEYLHQPTGARHIHLAADDDQNSFLVAFKTVPQDSTGVAHILEHTSLCGSKRYPVRDPFFMMTRRSLNTFMNAFTSSDWTAYPFASRNRKDFDNLLNVYLDAVFFPNLDRLDFAQEGHRLEFAVKDDPSSELTYKGVVFNEMKGAMSSPVSALWQSFTKHLFPTITYHNNSGGNPADIPNLTHEQLLAFHAKHYHPSNATFVSYGDIPASELQLKFHQQALAQFSKKEMDISVPPEQRYTTPHYFTDRYSVDENEPTDQKTHIVLGWLLDDITNAETVLRAHLLSGVLLDNSASPLRQVLETSDLGLAPSPLCGLSDSSREMVFACGLEGSDTDKADAVEQLILDTLHDIAENGVPMEMVEAVLHQLELSQREISGDGFPYGLQLMVHILGGVLHDADPMPILEIEPILATLRQDIADPEYIKREVAKLLNNQHRIRLVMTPDTQLATQQEQAEKQRLAAIQTQLTAEQKQQIVNLALELEQRQQQQDDPELLPKVGLEDIPATLQIAEGEAVTANLPYTWYNRGTNGLIYNQIVMDLPALTPQQITLLPLLSEIMTEVGSGGRDYLQTQILQSAVTGGIGASVRLRSNIADNQAYKGHFVLSGKALHYNHNALAELLEQTLFTPIFTEHDRILELIAQMRMHAEQRVTGSGHTLAMSVAASALTPVNAIGHQWSGLAGIQYIKHLDKQVTSDERHIEALAQQLTELHQLLLTTPRQLLIIGEEEQRQQLTDSMLQALSAHPNGTNQKTVTLPSPSGTVQQAWTTATQVNFCAKAYPTVAAEHSDSAALMVLAGFLRNNFLHRAVREQGGAYGGGASFDNDSGAFRFYSYRDPRLAATLQDFDASLEWLHSTDHPWRLIEESILGIISAIDKPGSPAGEAKSSFFASLHGRTPEQRNRFRQRVLQVTLADLQRVATTYLQPDKSHTAVITDPKRLAESGLQLQAIAL